jgi:hypothetical protein
LWARWVLTILGFAVLIVAIAIFVHHVNHESSASTSASARAEEEANREAEIVIAQDQAPHTAALHPGSGSATRVALERAIAGDVHARIDDGQLTGPLQSIHCQTSGAPRGGRQPFRCTVSSAGITYPFLAIADERRGELTWCKIDPAPAPGATEAPVSSRCRV